MRLSPFPICAAALIVSSASAHEPSRPADFDAKIRPILAAHCYSCHSKDAEKVKGDLRLDQLSADFADEAGRERWRAVLKRVKAGEMPPKSKPRPPEKEVQVLSDWIGTQLDAADAARRAQGRVVLRRLNRVEYENTVRDLLGVEVDLKELLPLDSSADGFDNVGAALHISSFVMERYLEAADNALDLAIANRPKPPPLVKKRYSLKDQHQVKTADRERVSQAGRHRGVLQLVPLASGPPVSRSIRRTGANTASASPPPGFKAPASRSRYRVDAGRMGMAGKNHLVGYFDAPADKPTVVEFVDHLEAQRHHSHPPLRTGRGAGRSTRSGPTNTRAGAGRPVGGGGRAAERHLAAGQPSPHLRRPAAGAIADAEHPRPRRGRLERPRWPTPSASCATSPAGPFAGR